MHKPFRTIEVALATGLLVIAAVAACFWTGKEKLTAEARQYIGVNGAQETHEFTFLQYRFRPILIWRSQSTGTRVIRREATFGAWTIEKLGSTQWCAKASGVYISGIARYDYGESHPFRLFYDFQRDVLLTTLDGRKQAKDVDQAYRYCKAS